MNGTTSSNITFTTTGTDVPEYSEEYKVAELTKKHSKKYFYTIGVSKDDDVWYQVYNSGWFDRMVMRRSYLRRKETSISNGTWISVRKRSHIQATLGATYLEIDKAIEDHKKHKEHEKYIKDVLETNPDNLKMISGLERLQEGDPQQEATSGTVAAAPSFPAIFASTFAVTLSNKLDEFKKVVCEGDLNINGELQINGEPLEEQIARKICENSTAVDNKTLMHKAGQTKKGEQHGS